MWLKILHRFTTAQGANIETDFSFGNPQVDKVMFMMNFLLDYHYSSIINITGYQGKFKCIRCFKPPQDAENWNHHTNFRSPKQLLLYPAPHLIDWPLLMPATKGQLWQLWPKQQKSPRQNWTRQSCQWHHPSHCQGLGNTCTGNTKRCTGRDMERFSQVPWADSEGHHYPAATVCSSPHLLIRDWDSHKGHRKENPGWNFPMLVIADISEIPTTTFRSWFFTWMKIHLKNIGTIHPKFSALLKIVAS